MAKIIHLARYYAPHIGGVETHVAELNKRLLANGDEVTVFCEEHDKTLPAEELIEGVKVIRMPSLSFKSRLLFFGFLNKLYFKIKVWTWIASKGKLLIEADVIQVHDVFWWIWPVYSFVYYKTYLTFHGWEGKYPISILAKAHRYYNSMAAKRTIHVGRFIQKFYWDKPTEVIFGGAKKSLLEESLPQQKNNNDLFISNDSHLVFIGRLEDVNEIEKVLIFLRLMKEKHPKIKITFVGDGAWRKECEELGRVTGFVKNTERYLREADVVVANSYLSILDSQALGKLVCAFYSNPVKESYLKTFVGAKYMFIEAQPEKIVLHLDKLSWKQVSFIAKKVKAFAQEQTWEKVAKIYQKLWQTPQEKN